MKLLRISWKMIVFIFLVITFVSISLFWRLWTRDIVRRRHHYTYTVSFFCNLCLKLMNFRIHVVGAPHKHESYLLVGNHLGILDILVISSLHPTLFITSVEMQQTPGLGFLTEMGGCLYVERRNRANIANEIEEIRTVLRQGFSIVLFPEGTSSDGRQVLPFKKSLLTSAVGSGAPILPWVINYRQVNGEPVSDKWRDYVCWYGDHTFGGALLRILSVKSADVEVRFLPTIEIHSEEQRREVAAHLQGLIESNYTPIL